MIIDIIDQLMRPMTNHVNWGHKRQPQNLEFKGQNYWSSLKIASKFNFATFIPPHLTPNHHHPLTEIEKG